MERVATVYRGHIQGPLGTLQMRELSLVAMRRKLILSESEAPAKAPEAPKGAPKVLILGNAVQLGVSGGHKRPCRCHSLTQICSSLRPQNAAKARRSCRGRKAPHADIAPSLATTDRLDGSPKAGGSDISSGPTAASCCHFPLLLAVRANVEPASHLLGAG